MSIEELMELKRSNEAPFNHDDYTIWLHNKIIERVISELVMIAGVEIPIESALKMNRLTSLRIIK